MNTSTERLGGSAETPLLRRISVATFSWVMGIGGLSNAYSAAHAVLGMPLWPSQLLLVLAALFFGALLLVQLAKTSIYFDSVREEFEHPIRSSFFPAISVAALVLSIGIRAYSDSLARVLWCAGTGVHLLLALTLIRRWILHFQDESVMTPAWFIPVVGNILVPVGGVPLGYLVASWFFFSVGLVFWLLFFTIALHRLLFFATLSERSIPTLFILLAPPSIGLSAYFAFTSGTAGPLADILYSLALFIAMLLTTMARQITHGEFFMSWWALTFPLDGWAGACIYYYRARPAIYTQTIASISLAAATIVLLFIAAKTIQQVIVGRAFHEE